MRMLLSASLMLTAPAALMAQDRDSAGDDADGAQAASSAIVVIATRIAGQVETDIPPIMTLDADDITAYGSSSIGELLEAISPQTGSGRGRGGGHPVILLNGQRISSFRQLRDIPPEAIRRMEVLPEEVALRFGYAPDQRVVNFILKDSYSTVQVAGEYNLPTRGGFANRELEAGIVRFDGPQRFNLNWIMVDESLLTEAERGIAASADEQSALASDPDPVEYRSLIDDSVTHKLTGTWSTGLGKDGLDGTLAFDGEIRVRDARGLLGLDSVRLVAPDGSEALRTLPGAIARDTRTSAFEGGITLNKPLSDWQFTATADAAYTETTTHTDRRADLADLQAAASAGQLALDAPLPPPSDPGRDRARNRLLTLSTFAGLSGSPLRLPAGPVTLNVDAGYDRLDNRAANSQIIAPQTKLARDIAKLGVNLSFPITGGRENFADALGSISLNFSGNLHDFSDFGTLNDWSAGIIWSPTDKLTFNASHIVTEVAPSVGQLGNPRIETFNVPVFDFASGGTAVVSIISGGNPDLRAERQRDIKLSANWQIDLFDRSSIIVEYFRNRSDDVTRSFPLLTPAIEAAFPGRAIRDAGGNLLAIDRRPVTFDQVATERLRWGVNLSGRIGQQEGRGGSGGSEARPGGGAGGPGMMPFGRGGRGGRWNIAMYHTWQFVDTVRLGSLSDPLDQLAGDSLVAGGVPRHALELEGGVFNKGLGLRLKASWSAPARVLASGGPGSADLRFGSVLDIGGRLFFNFGARPELVERAPLLKGVRIALDFTNLLDSRQRVTDGNGAVPFAYQRAFRDPRGRVIGIDIRKSF